MINAKTKRLKYLPWALSLVPLLLMSLTAGVNGQAVFPGEEWAEKTPAEAGLNEAVLDQIQAYMAGRAVIVRYGYLVYSWGSMDVRRDIASAAKPFYSHFLFEALEGGKLSSLDEKAVNYEPCLNDINPVLGYKDRDITFRQMANQISDYGVTEAPGTAFDYNDWQMALFWDTLFLKVYGATYSNVDATVFDPLLNDVLQMQDDPTFLSFGEDYKPGRVSISVRDHARFGLLYLNKGNWDGIQLIDPQLAEMAVTDPVPLSIPRTQGIEAEMCPDQRTHGSGIIPDNQFDNDGSYSWLWWINGTDTDGNKKWPDGPGDAFAALGHSSKRGLAVLPSQGIVIAWNDTILDEKTGDVHPLNEVLKLLVQSVEFSWPTPTPNPPPSVFTVVLPLVSK
jgi:hypothetical protein